jgi:hypothetical protein
MDHSESNDDFMLPSPTPFHTEKSIFKRTRSTSLLASPQKKKGCFKSQSAITTTLASGTTTSLMKFFNQNTPEQHQEQVQRETEESIQLFNVQKEKQGIRKAEKSEKAWASNHEHQQRHQACLYKEQIKTGDRSPGGTKHNVSWQLVYQSNGHLYFVCSI